MEVVEVHTATSSNGRLTIVVCAGQIACGSGEDIAHTSIEALRNDYRACGVKGDLLRYIDGYLTIDELDAVVFAN